MQAAGAEASGQAINPSWLLLGAVVLCIIGAGLRFIVNFFQVYFLPHITLRRVAEDEHFFYSLVLVIAGSAAVVLGLSLALPSFDKVASDYINETVSAQVTGSSANYRDLAQQQARLDLQNIYELVFHTNIFILVLIPVFFWLLFMTLIWIFAKLFHTPIAYAHFIRTTAYNAFIFGIAAGGMVYYQIKTMAMDPIESWIVPVAWILAVYAVIHLFISLVQGLDISPVGIVVSLVLAGAIIAGIGYGMVYQWGIPWWDDFWSKANAFDPSR